MKNKAPLPLMEQLIMVLIFSLTAAICMQGFATSDRISRRQEARDQAVIHVQNTAELLKLHAGDYSAVADALDLVSAKDCWYLPFDSRWQPQTDLQNARYLLEITPEATDSKLLGSASVSVYTGDDLLFRITTAWQEGHENAH